MDDASTMTAPETQTRQSRLVSTEKRKRGRVELSVQQIIEKAENEPVKFRYAAIWSALAGLMLWASYPPLSWSPLAWIAILPWLLMIRIEQPTRRMLLASYFGGLCFTIPALQWMRYGDPLMYIGWMALAIYVAAYIPAFIGITRIAVHRWNFPVLVAAPVVWTGLEYLRGFLFTGFGWYYLGHSQVQWLELIQISDLVGAYGVSFVMVLFISAVAVQIPATWMRRIGLLKPGEGQAEPRAIRSLIIATAVLVTTLGYGYYRCSVADFQPGPRVALIQGNFRASLIVPPNEYEESFLVHNELTGMAVEYQPDVIVWPEGMFRYALLEADPNLSAADLSQIAPNISPGSWRNSDVNSTLATMSEKAGAALVIGLGAYVASPEGLAQYNAAQFVTPETGVDQRYDKIHRVPFGEYIPGSDSPLLSGFFPQNFGLTAGKQAVPFDYQSWRFAPIICFEDTVPHVTRKITHAIESQSDKPVDVLINLSNDGWFAGSSEHNQHLITAQFRAVELRKPLVRAANMGISSCIDGNGQVLEPEVFMTKDPVNWQPREISYIDPETGTYRKKLEAVLVQTVPLDNRSSLYLMIGDWFAAACLFACGALILSRWFPRRKTANRNA